MNWPCATINHRLDSDRAWVDSLPALGYSEIELCPRYTMETTEDLIAYALEKGVGVSLHVHHGPNNITDTDAENQKLSVSQVKYCIDLVARYGLSTVTFHPGRLSAEGESEAEKWQQLFAVVEEIAAYAKEKQVRVAIENMELRPMELVYTIEDLNKFAYIGENNPWFGVTLDFAHFASLGIIKPDLSQLKLPVFNIHLSQLTEEKMHAPLTAQNGKVDVPGVCKLLRDYGYTGRIILELSADYAESLQLFQEISRNI
ncbi:MAG: sugar phosphate isomerase/epimerase [Oscillospiraceae bacterium]|nr:sugar phosphate isomerase/epimerase [Oscillospiraceae bacterium]